MTGPQKPDQSNPSAGSPGNGEPAYLAVGKLHRPHGVHGEIVMEVLTDFPERLVTDMRLYVGPEYKPLTLRQRRWHRDLLLVTFEGYNTPEEISVFRNHFLFVLAEDRPPLPAGEYYHHQLIGMLVFDETGAALGTIYEILTTGANDVLVVRPQAGSDILLPMINDVVLDIDLVQQRVQVHVLPGLLPDETKNKS